MSSIKVSELRPVGYKLCLNTESFLNKLND